MRRFVVCLFFAALPIHAAVINVEGPQDSLAGAPTINHCTLRKAIINSNTNAATYPQCISGSGIDTITFNSPFVITFALAGANEDAGLTGDLDVTEATTNITSCTITNNNPGFSNLTGGVRALGAVTLRNTIVAGNGGTDIPNLDGTFTSAGYNVIGNLGTRADNPTIVATTGDQIGVSFASINLGSLQDNGGPVATRALQSGSIAIDKGHSSGSSVDAR